jgi:hypothetical protein
MTRSEAQTKFDTKIAALTIDAAIECYTMLRHAVFAKRDRDTAQAMVMTGNSLEAIIGEEAFDLLLDTIETDMMAAA